MYWCYRSRTTNTCTPMGRTSFRVLPSLHSRGCVQWTHTTYINFFLGWLGNLTCGFCINQYFLHTCWESRFLWFKGLDSFFHSNKALKMCHAFTFCSKVTSINHATLNFVFNSLNVNLKFASKVWRVKDWLTKLDTALHCQEDVCTLKKKIFALTKHAMLNVS